MMLAMFEALRLLDTREQVIQRPRFKLCTVGEEWSPDYTYDIGRCTRYALEATFKATTLIDDRSQASMAHVNVTRARQQLAAEMFGPLVDLAHSAEYHIRDGETEEALDLLTKMRALMAGEEVEV